MQNFGQQQQPFGQQRQPSGFRFTPTLEPGKYHFTNPSVSNPAPAFDFQRMERYMETISRSMETINGRLNSLEKGLPSHTVPSLMDPTFRPLVHLSGRAPLPGPSSHPSGPIPLPRQALLPTSWAQPRTHWGLAPPKASGKQPWAQPRTTVPVPLMAHFPPLEARFQSDNPDFAVACKALYRTTQIRRQQANWKTVPLPVQRDLQYIASSINPVHPTPEVVRDISSILADTGTRLVARLHTHFSDQLELNLTRLRHSNPLDKAAMVDKVVSQITNRMGRKVPEPEARRLVEAEAMVIGVREVRSEAGEVIDCDGFQKATHTCKKPRIATSPNSIATHNLYSDLPVDDDDDSDVVEGTPSPVRKISRPHPKLNSSSVPRTTLSFTPATTLSNTDSNPNTDPNLKPVAGPSCANADQNLKPRPASSILAPLPQRPTAKLAKPRTSASVTAPIQPPTPLPAPISASAPPVPLTGTPSLRFSHHPGFSKPHWKVPLLPGTRHLIVSDSNMKYLTSEDIPEGFQVACFSGANFYNTSTLLSALPSGKPLDHLVLALGINHKDEPDLTRVSTTLPIRLSACGDKAKEVLAVGVSINLELAPNFRTNLSTINQRIKSQPNITYIPPLPSASVVAEKDTVHYTKATQQHILTNIIQTIQNKTKN